jgi:ABC-type lipoprotein export system ATPase subunit
MPRVDLIVEASVSSHPRVRQLEGMFDVPRQDVQRVEWHGEVPIEDKPWSVGLIVGPSGCGKSSVARQMFGSLVDIPVAWDKPSTIECFDQSRAMEDITSVCQAVGFNTVPAWMRPHHVLSNGERFRAELARRLLEGGDLVVVDEFTSVVDRQVAKIASHAVQKYARRNGKRFVAISCHYDVVDWLQPDWVLEPATMSFAWRSVQPRPKLDVEIYRASYEAWHSFAPFHYLTSELHRSARCYVLSVGGHMAAFAGMLFRPISQKGRHVPIYGCSRLVTLPDYQGLGLAFALIDAVAGSYLANGSRTRTYPAHPSLIRAFDRSPVWRLVKRPGRFSSVSNTPVFAGTGARPCAVFEYAGPRSGSNLLVA